MRIINNGYLYSCSNLDYLAHRHPFRDCFHVLRYYRCMASLVGFSMVDLKLIQYRSLTQAMPLINSDLRDELGDEFHDSMHLYLDDPDGYPNWEIFLLTLDGATIGVCGIYCECDVVNNPRGEWWLGWLGIVPEHRSKGLGKYLVNEMEIMARRYDCQVLLVHCEDDKIHFYGKLGFSEITDGEELDRYIKEATSECSAEGFKDSILRKTL